MFTIFNRRELAITFDMKKQYEIRECLSSNGIEYRVRTVNRGSSSPVAYGVREEAGTFGMDLAKMYEYIIYVKKADLEKARYLIRSNGL